MFREVSFISLIYEPWMWFGVLAAVGFTLAGISYLDRRDWKNYLNKDINHDLDDTP